MKTNRLFVYKCVVDNGGAPCLDNDLLTLTICKPYIRSTAKKGDIVFAFGSNNDTISNRLVYIAEVSERVENARYFNEERFSRRPDCIYQFESDDHLVIRRNAKFHRAGENMSSDVGRWPDYSLANALVSEDFRYFGSSGTDDWKINAPHLKELVENLGQGHRVNFSQALRTELVALKSAIWYKYNRGKVLGRPQHGIAACDTDESSSFIKICPKKCFSSPIASGKRRASPH